MSKTLLAFVCLLLFSVASDAATMALVDTPNELATYRRRATNEAALVLDGGSFVDGTGQSVLFVLYPSSTAATNTTDTLAAIGGGRWIVRRFAAEPTPILHADDRIAAWFNSSSFSITNAQVSYLGVITNATLRWPDGATGTYTVTSIDTSFSAPNSWTYTHSITGKTFTQSAVTRDSASGVVTGVPTISVTPAGDVFQYPWTNYIGGVGYYLDLNAFRAATNNFTVVLIGSDTNGIPGTWARGAGSGADDGANWWSDAAGIQVKRIQ